MKTVTRIFSLGLLSLLVATPPMLTAQERGERGGERGTRGGGERGERTGGGERGERGAGRNRWSEMSEEERAAARERMRGAAANFDPAEANRWREIFSSMSQEERTAWRQAAEGMSREEMMALGEQLMNMSPTEREQWFDNARAQVIESGGGAPEATGAAPRGAEGAQRGGERRFGGAGGRGGAGGGAVGGGGRASLRGNVPEEYQPLIANSPFMSDEYRASLVRASGNASRRQIQFTGFLHDNGERVFGLLEPRANRDLWLMVGESAHGLEILEYDETSDRLTVSIDGNEARLDLNPRR